MSGKSTRREPKPLVYDPSEHRYAEGDELRKYRTIVADPPWEMPTGGAYRGSERIAMCPAHPEEPLVSTFHWRSKEFICLKCGRLYEWLQPVAKNATPRRLARMEAREAEWQRNASALLTVGARHIGCDKCEAGEYHTLHATEEEWQAHRGAQYWLLVRTGRKVAA